MNIAAEGEKLAREHLEGEGLKFCEANLRVPHGEIDLVMEDKQNKALVFVEVKSRSSESFGTPAESITPDKKRVLARSIQFALKKYNWRGNYRLDLVTVLLKDRENPQIEHIPYLEI